MLKYILLVSFIPYSLFTSAQVQVRDEPRHHNVFENEFIRILDAYVGPGDTSLYHLHNTPSVFIVLANANVGSQLLGGQPQVGANLSGTITYDKIATPRTHKVWNADTSWFHVMDIELTGKGQREQPIIKNENLKLLFNEKEVNGYKAELRSKQELQLPASVSGYLIVSLSETEIDLKSRGKQQHRIMKAGHYIWVEQGENLSFSRGNQSISTFVILQLK